MSWTKVRVLKEYVLILAEGTSGIRSRHRQAQTPTVAEYLFGIHVSEENMKQGASNHQIFDSFFLHTTMLSSLCLLSPSPFNPLLCWFYFSSFDLFLCPLLLRSFSPLSLALFCIGAKKTSLVVQDKQDKHMSNWHLSSADCLTDAAFLKCIWGHLDGLPACLDPACATITILF